MKCFAEACERNRDPILAVLREVLPQSGQVLEIASGTGQHAAYFSGALPGLRWQPSDLEGSLASIEAWREDSDAPNLSPPIVINLLGDIAPPDQVDAVVCINTVHIVAWQGVEQLFHLASKSLRPHGVLYLYGPYRYRDRALEPSNETFDSWLKTRDPMSGIRDYEAIEALAESTGFSLGGDRGMPANNRSIWWIREEEPA